MYKKLFILPLLLLLLMSFNVYSARSPSISTSVETLTTIYNIQGTIGINVKDDDYGAEGDGVTDDYASINLALSAASASGQTLVFPEGTYKISTSINLTTGVFFAEGASISVDSGKTLTISGDNIYAGRYQIFEGSGTVTLTGNFQSVFPEWFGATADGVTDDTDAIQATLTAMANGGELLFNSGTYFITAIDVGDNTQLVGSKGTKIYFDAGLDRYVQHSGSVSTNVRISGIEFYSDYVKADAEAHTYGVRGNFINLIVENCIFRNLGRDGCNFAGTSSNVIVRNCTIYDMPGNGIAVRNGDNFKFIDNHIYDCDLPGINVELDSALFTVSNVLIQGNTIDNCWKGIQVKTGTVNDVVINDNIIMNCDVGGLDLSSSKICTLNDNTIHDNVNYGIRIAVDYGVLNDNIIYDNNNIGIQLVGSNRYSLTGNKCFNNSETSVVQTTPITYSGSYSSPTYIGNQFIDYVADTGNTDDTDSYFTGTGSGATALYGRKFTGIDNQYIEKVKLRLTQLGDPSGTVYVKIYSNNAGVPGTALSSRSDDYNISSIGDGTDLFEFKWAVDFETAKYRTTNTTYWAVVETVGFTQSVGVEELILRTDADGGSSEVAVYDAGGGTWSLLTASAGADIIVEYVDEQIRSENHVLFNTPRLDILTEDNNYRDISWVDGAAEKGRIRYFDSTVETSDEIRLGVAGNSDVFSLSSGGSIYLWNHTEQDTDGGRVSRIYHEGEQSGGEVTTLGYTEFSHDGSSDDEKGKFVLKLNDGNDGGSPSINGLSIASTGKITFGENLIIGSHFISNDGDDEGISVDGSGNITFTGSTSYAVANRPSEYLFPKVTDFVVSGDGSSNAVTVDDSYDGTNYRDYERTTGLSDTQDINLVWHGRLPDEYASWLGSNSLSIWVRASDYTNCGITITAKDGDGNVDATVTAYNIQVAANNTWTQKQVEFGSVMVAGEQIILDINITSLDTADTVDFGEITIGYKAGR